MREVFVCVILLLLLTTPVCAENLIQIVSSADGYTARNSANAYTTVRAGAGTTSGFAATTTYLGYLRGHTTASYFDRFYRGVLVFDTSSLPDACNITSAELVVYVTAKATALGSPDYVVTGITPATPATPATTDFNQFTQTELSGRITNANIVVGILHIPLNTAGLAYINKTGYTDLCLRDTWDVDNLFGGAWVSAAVTSVTIASNESANDPFLVIGYTDCEECMDCQDCPPVTGYVATDQQLGLTPWIGGLAVTAVVIYTARRRDEL